MRTGVEQLQMWMEDLEDEHLEFKEAKNNYHFERLVKYCAALANEGGGKIILGVTDRRPRRVVGTNVFPSLERTKAGLVERLRLRVDLEEVSHSDGRVLVFHVPSRPIGMPISFQGAYWMRAGEDLVPMTNDQIKKIFEEVGPDFSAELCSAATFADLDPNAIADFRRRWITKSRNATLTHLSPEQLLADAELVVEGRITYAALVLLGTRIALGRHLAQAEVVFEHRASEASGPAQQRVEFREGFFLFYEGLWDLINVRNEMQHFQEGLFIRDVPTFNEIVIREAVLNAISHRDYRLAGSVFIRQFPRRMEVISPGGFPEGITPENVLEKQLPRNRRIAEAFAKCGLVERSGQGMNRMFEECVKESKPRPEFTGTDAYQVALTLRGTVQNPIFLRFLEQVGRERIALFSTQDFLTLDYIARDERVPDGLKGRQASLVEQGVLECVGRGRGTRYILSRRFHGFLGSKGAYTRKRGLDRNTNKMLLLKHIKDNNNEGSQLADLRQVLPSLSYKQVQTLIRELKEEGRIRVEGRTRGSRWYPTSST